MKEKLCKIKCECGREPAFELIPSNIICKYCKRRLGTIFNKLENQTQEEWLKETKKLLIGHGVR